jgi:hypothetical protein
MKKFENRLSVETVTEEEVLQRKTRAKFFEVFKRLTVHREKVHGEKGHFEDSSLQLWIIKIFLSIGYHGRLKRTMKETRKPFDWKK